MRKIFVAVVFSFAILALSDKAFSMCAENKDWPEAPCFDVLPVNREEFRQAWAPYYSYKGSEWMEQKREEMLAARDDGRLSEWIGMQSHHNVYSYYLSRGEISPVPPYDYPFFEDDFRYYLQFFGPGGGLFLFVIIGILIATLGITAAFVIRGKNAAKS